jgi:long-chain acyl-CoA synthetase
MHISQLVFRAEQLRGAHAATEFMDKRYTWAQTADRVRRIAGALQGLGLGRNDQIAILSLNSNVYFESLFGIPMTGARMVPLNIRWAAPEFVYTLQDSASKALLFDRQFQPLVDSLRAEDIPVEHFLFMGDPQDCPDWAQSLETLLAAAQPQPDYVHGDDHLAGIFYTGGTTGFPKGVMLTHTALFTSALSLAAASPADENCSMLHAAPMFHMADLAACFVFTILAAKHVIVPAFEPVLVAKTIKNSGVTDALLVPAMIQLVFDHPEFDPASVQGLKRILYGASPMPEGLLRRVMTALPGMEMVQAYGQTEMAPIMTVLMPDEHVTQGERSKLLRSAGRATYCVQLKIIDENGKTLSSGQVGEICAIGPNAMLGYWNKPKQTADTIIDGWVHSGDAGYLDEEGYLFIVDRVKDMIVSGGENVYSAEVESAVSTHPAVAQVAVVGIPDEEWGEAVHAIIVPRTGQTASVQDIIDHCRSKIAGYKCPKSISFRDEPLPLSGAGKVLKRELRAPFWEGRSRQVN